MNVELRHGPTRKLRRHVDDRGNLGRSLPGFGDTAYPFLSSIDPYDDTFFNSYQMAAVLPELRQRLAETSSDELLHVIELAEACSERVGLFLVFVGD